MNKKTFTNKKRKAFSLIELSIVLIIIGLLVAGVTGGAALIKNANLRGVMTEARGYQTAVNGFFERFQALPGDFSQVVGGSFTLPATPTTTATATGNGNGLIEYVNSRTYATDASRMESNIAWQQLKNGGFVDATFTPATSSSETAVKFDTDMIPGSNIPGSKLTGAGWIFDYVNSQNAVIITGSITANPTLVDAASLAAAPTAILLPVDAFSIDTKTDDGVANAGKVRASTVTSSCNGTTTYKTASTSADCALSFQVDPAS